MACRRLQFAEKRAMDSLRQCWKTPPVLRTPRRGRSGYRLFSSRITSSAGARLVLQQAIGIEQACRGERFALVGGNVELNQYVVGHGIFPREMGLGSDREVHASAGGLPLIKVINNQQSTHLKRMM